MKKYRFKKYLPKLLMGATLLIGPVSHASEVAIETSIGEKAVSIAKRVQSKKLITTINEAQFEKELARLNGKEKVDYLRRVTMGSLTLRNQLPQSVLAKQYLQEAVKANEARDLTLSTMFMKYAEHSDTGGKFKDFDELRIKLVPYLDSDDWVVSHRAKIFLAIAESYTLDVNTALSNATEAYGEIPNEQSIYVNEAIIESLSLIAYLHNLLNNPELAVNATEDLINRQLALGYNIDGANLINNLIYSLGKWQDFKTTSKLAKILVDIEDENSATVTGLSQLRLAQTLNDSTDYKGSLVAIDSTIDKVEHKTIKANLLINRAIALAGLGRLAEAERAYKDYQSFKTEINLESNNLKSRELMADALIAQAHGDMQTAFSKMQARNRDKIQRILNTNNAGTAKLLANLENTKERQAEREAGLQREANLQKAKAEQQRRINQLLFVLVGLLSIAALLSGIFARYRDKISKKLAIKTREAEDADRMKSEFLGMVSHELRTPLNGIVGIADLLSQKAPTQDLRQKAGIILESSNQLTHVVESIVDMSSIDGNKMDLYPEPTNVYELVTARAQNWAPSFEDKGVIFTSFVESKLADTVDLDKDRFAQCLDNLLSNAAKFTSEGRVHLHVTGQPTEIENEMQITAIIADTGQGMSEEVQSKLFTPFLQADSSMTRKHGGSGLGLAITRSLARLMGGDVTMMSNEGRGSEFTITIKGQKSAETSYISENIAIVAPQGETLAEDIQPDNIPQPSLIESTAEPADYAPIQAVQTGNMDVFSQEEDLTPSPEEPRQALAYDKESLRGLKVLIVDDVAANHDVIKLFLVPEGCECYEALNGVEALKILETQEIDIILMDVRMPEMDGIQATQAIRSSGREFKDTSIIALTADIASETNAACMAAGADIFLTKPIMARDLIESIKFIRRFEDFDETQVINVA